MSKICKKCGKESDDMTKICPGCGTVFEEDTAVREAPKFDENVLPSIDEIFAKPKEFSEQKPVREQQDNVPEQEAAEQPPKNETEDQAVPEEKKTVEAQQNRQPAEMLAPSPFEQMPEQTQLPEFPPVVPVPPVKKEIPAKEEAPVKKEVPAARNVPAAPVQKPKKRVTVGGVFGAIILTFLLIINLAIGAAVVGGMGFALSDISQFSLTLDGYEYSIQSIDELFSQLEEDELSYMLDDFFAQDSILIYMNGEEYEVEFDKDVLSGLEEVISYSNRLSSLVSEGINALLRILFVVMAAIAAYVFVATYLNVYSIYSALGKTKRAHIVSGSVFVVFGITLLVFAIASSFVPGVINNEYVTAFMGQMMVTLFVVIHSMLTSAVGFILFFSGIFGKNKN